MNYKQKKLTKKQRKQRNSRINRIKSKNTVKRFKPSSPSAYRKKKRIVKSNLDELRIAFISAGRTFKSSWVKPMLNDIYDRKGPSGVFDYKRENLPERGRDPNADLIVPVTNITIISPTNEIKLPSSKVCSPKTQVKKSFSSVVKNKSFKPKPKKFKQTFESRYEKVDLRTKNKFSTGMDDDFDIFSQKMNKNKHNKRRNPEPELSKPSQPVEYTQICHKSERKLPTFLKKGIKPKMDKVRKKKLKPPFDKMKIAIPKKKLGLKSFKISENNGFLGKRWDPLPHYNSFHRVSYHIRQLCSDYPIGGQRTNEGYPKIHGLTSKDVEKCHDNDAFIACVMTTLLGKLISVKLTYPGRKNKINKSIKWMSSFIKGKEIYLDEFLAPDVIILFNMILPYSFKNPRSVFPKMNYDNFEFAVRFKKPYQSKVNGILRKIRNEMCVPDRKIFFATETKLIHTGDVLEGFSFRKDNIERNNIEVVRSPHYVHEFPGYQQHMNFKLKFNAKLNRDEYAPLYMLCIQYESGDTQFGSSETFYLEELAQWDRLQQCSVLLQEEFGICPKLDKSNTTIFTQYFFARTSPDPKNRGGRVKLVRCAYNFVDVSLQKTYSYPESREGRFEENLSYSHRKEIKDNSMEFKSCLIIYADSKEKLADFLSHTGQRLTDGSGIAGYRVLEIKRPYYLRSDSPKGKKTLTLKPKYRDRRRY